MDNKLTIQNWEQLETFVKRIRESGSSKRPTIIGDLQLSLSDELIRTLLVGSSGEEKIRYPQKEILAYMKQKADMVTTEELQKELSLSSKQVNAAVFLLNQAGKIQRLQKAKYQLPQN